MGNTLYYGDNLEILQRYIPDESINLIYLDRPFKSDQTINVLFLRVRRLALSSTDSRLKLATDDRVGSGLHERRRQSVEVRKA